MCKQYVYLSHCLEHDCDSIVGKKGRNTYCRAARHGAPRRLGSCDGGLEYVTASRHRGTVLCDECKQLRALRQLSSSSVSVAAAGKGKGESRSTGGNEVVLRSDDGGSSSSWETVRGDDDDEDTGSPRFFATKREKAERLASAYDCDLALKQEIARLDKQNTRAASPEGEEEDDEYLSVTGGPDDSTIEYEHKVPESNRHEGLGPSGRNYYYGFAAVGFEERIPPRLRPRPLPQPRPQYVDQEEVQWVRKRQTGRDDAYDSGTTATVIVMTSSGSESESDAEVVNVKHDLRSKLKKTSSVPETATSDTVMDADDFSSDGEPEFNDKLDIQLRPGFLNRACVDRVDGHDTKITPTNPRRGLIPEQPLATDERPWSEDEDDTPGGSRDGSDKDDGDVKKEDESHGYEKDEEDDERDDKRARPSYWDTVLEDGTKRRRTA